MSIPSRGKNKQFSLSQPAEFVSVLRRERALADRTESGFALVLFSIAGSRSSSEVGVFLETVSARVRAADSMGWYDSGTLGVLLRGTLHPGAVKLAFDVLSFDEAARVCPRFRVLQYPEPGHDSAGAAGNGREEHRNFIPSGEELQTVFVRRIPVWKRAIDLSGAVTALTLCAPVMLLVAAYIKIVSPGPVFFRQERVGYRGKLFTFLKFRTMKPGNDVSAHREHLRELIRSDMPMWKLDTVNDPRIIPGGNIIRKLSLDELPQFINVLRGEMSLVGPRPCIPYEAEEYLRWHTRRFDAYPGLSGLWQVSGKNRLSFKEMIRLDIAYANNMSFLLDLKIILKTFPTLVGMALEKPASLFRQSLSRNPRPADPGTV